MSRVDAKVTRAVQETNAHYARFANEIKGKTRAEIQAIFLAHTERLKRRLEEQKQLERGDDERKETLALQKIMPEAFGLVKAASAYLFGKPHYDVQLIGGMALNDGCVAEMGTGEGKTLTATLPAYLNALAGKHVHIMTPNPYLANRDFLENRPLFELLGLSCGLVDEKPRSQRVIEDKKRAYSRDIIYGSSSAFAFDYLYDGLENNPDRMVYPEGEPDFAIIDEADAILFDDARVPFIISGQQKDGRISLDDSTRAKRSKTMHDAVRATQKFYPYIEELRHKEYEELMKPENEDEYEEKDKKVALVLDTNTKEYTITTLGYAMLYTYYRKKEVSDILRKNGITYITEMEVYNMIMSGTIPELKEKFDEFSGNDLMSVYDHISKATTAWYALEIDKDYALKQMPGNKFSISPVTNGRLIGKRKYTNGLQQAIEEKEMIKNPNLVLTETKLSDTLASIPASSFFKRYKKLSGMTGTSIRGPLEEMYNLSTYEVPPNVPKRVKNQGERFFPSTSAKYDAIFKDALETHKAGRPVLITTTSISKSEGLARYLQDRFRQAGIDIDIPVLNANVQKLREEAEIISKAGRAGAITISTEMAGRGTDIKLGGGEPTYERQLASVIGLALQQQQLRIGREFTYEERLKFIAAIKDRPEIRKKATDTLAQARKNEEERISNLGGLKVIGSGHFKFTRIDNQVRGRCGRQGNCGETVFYNDPTDLAEIGIPKEQVSMVEKILAGEEKTETKKGILSLGSLIQRFQNMSEERQYSGIKANEEMEKNISEYRSIMYDYTTNVRREGSYFNCIDQYIDEITSRILYYSNPAGQGLDDDTKLSRARIDYANVRECSRKIFGSEITEEEMSECLNVEDLRNFISNKAKNRWHTTIDQVGEEIMEPMVKGRVDTTLNRMWNTFEGLVETIQDQYTSSALGLLDTKEQLSSQMAVAFDYSIETEVVDLLSCMLNPKYGKEGEYMDHLRNVEVSPTEVKIHPREKGEREFTQDYINEARAMK